jgi:hypothetical protein
MSKILRRPMFRGGPVNSYGTGIASGLADGGRVGFRTGGSYLTLPEPVTSKHRQNKCNASSRNNRNIYSRFL